MGQEHSFTNKIGFVILHYGNNIEITKKSISFIKQLGFHGIKDIVVVCNGLQFNIRDEIEEDIHVEVLEENRGFSVGNNTGYTYLKEKDDYDFIIILNNDVHIEQTDFTDRLYEAYIKTPFYVGGPDVYVPYRDYHSSPLRNAPFDLDGIEKKIKDREILDSQLHSFFSLRCLKLYFREAFKYRELYSMLSRSSRKHKKDTAYTVQHEDVVLQGSCLIFSRDYISQNEKAFIPEVFLYYEEEYLALRCREMKWKTIYIPELQVMHYHRVSSGLHGLSYREYCNEKIKINRIFVESSKQYREYLLQTSISCHGNLKKT